MKPAPALTTAERQTINKAMNIILAHTVYGASWQIGANHYRDAGPPSHSICYFTSAGTQHSFCRGDTFADRIDYALSRENEEALSEEEARARRIQKLRDEIARLEAAEVA